MSNCHARSKTHRPPKGGSEKADPLVMSADIQEKATVRFDRPLNVIRCVYLIRSQLRASILEPIAKSRFKSPFLFTRCRFTRFGKLFFWTTDTRVAEHMFIGFIGILNTCATISLRYPLLRSPWRTVEQSSCHEFKGRRRPTEGPSVRVLNDGAQVSERGGDRIPTRLVAALL